MPLAFVSVFTSIFLALYAFYEIITRIYNFILKITAVGFSIHPSAPELFFINTSAEAILRYLALAFLLAMLIGGFAVGGTRLRKIFSLDTVYFAALYGFIAPLWLLKAVYNVFISGNVPWR